MVPKDFRSVSFPNINSLSWRERRASIKAVAESLSNAATDEKRSLTPSEQQQFEDCVSAIQDGDAQEKREAAAAAHHLASGSTEVRGYNMQTRVSGGETYHRGATSPSYFRDMLHAQRGDFEAIQRLHRNNQEVGLEARALGNTGGTGGSGGEFAPPSWLVNDFVKLARPGRVTANLFHHETLEPGVSSVNLPRIATGTTTAIQSTQNTALSQTDLTTNSLSSSIVTIGGKQIVAQQLLDQSGTGFDKVILEDLTADYAKQLGTQVLTGSGASGQLKGFLTATSSNNQTWTQASPTASLFYSQLAKLQGSINATRYASPDTVVMHPRRWAWFASFTDSTGRPLVVPAAGGFNSLANPSDNVAAGFVGSVLGMDVYTDPNLPINLGAGTNQDVVLMFKRDDIWLWESNLRAEVLTQTYGDSLGVLIRCYNYAAMIPDRYASTLGQIQGTGLVTPTFAG